MDREANLHPLACRSRDATRSQTIDPIEPDEHRMEFARDRDRILYSRCFRRLAHKTQVFLTSEGMEHARMRLTHTLEVSQVARTIARALRMNEDLVEAISLGHDVGHAPFGHAGEVQLHKFLQTEHAPPRHMPRHLQRRAEQRIPRLDFRHNFQSVRLLSTLEKYELGAEGGLGLTDQCLEGILKHTRFAPREKPTKPYKYPDNTGLFGRLLRVMAHRTIESQIVAIADELTQLAHDLADAVLYLLVTVKDLPDQPVIGQILRRTTKGNRLGKLIAEDATPHTVAGHLASMLLSYFVEGSIRVAMDEVKAPRRKGAPLPVLWRSHVPEPADEFSELMEYKDKLVVNCYDVNRMDNKGAYIIRQLLDAYVSDPRQLPDAAFDRYKKALGGAGIRTADELHKVSAFLVRDMRLKKPEVVAVAGVVNNKGRSGLRQLKASVLSKLPYYLLFDAQWRRTIADQVAMMTDSNAEREMRALYGVA